MKSKIYLLMGGALIGFGAGMIHFGLGLIFTGLMCWVASWLEYEKEIDDGNKNTKEGNSESNYR